MIREYLRVLPLLSRDARLVLMASGVAGFSYSGVTFLLANLYLLRLGCGAEFVGMYAGTGALSFAVSCIPAGLVGRRLGYRVTMIGGFSVTGAGLGLVGLAVVLPDEWRQPWLLSCCALREFGNAFFSVNANPFLVEATEPELRSHVFSARSVLGTLGGFTGSLIGGVLPRLSATALGSSTADPVVYLIPMLLGVVLYLPGIAALASTSRREGTSGPRSALVKERAGPALARLRALRRRSRRPGGPAAIGDVVPAPPAEESSTSEQTPRSRPLQPKALGPHPFPYAAMGMMAVVAVLTNGALATAMSFYNVYMDSFLKVSTARIGAVAGGCQLVAAAGAVAIPAIVSRLGTSRTFALACAGMSLGALPLALAGQWLGAGAGVIGVGVMNTIAFPAITLYHQELVRPDWRSVMSGVHMMSCALAWTCLGAGGGFLIVWQGYRVLFLLGAAMTALGSGVFWLYARVPRGEYARQASETDTPPLT